MIRATSLTLLLLGSLCPAAEPPYTVDRGDINQVVRERGVLDAANAVDVVAPAGGSKEKPLVIKWVIEEGSYVKKGDRLIEFEDSFLRDQMAAQKLATDQASALATMAERELAMARLGGAKEIRSAEGALELAQLVLKNSTESDAVARKRAELRVKHAEVALAKARLTFKGENTEAAQLGVRSAEIELEATALDLKQLDLSSGAARRQSELRVRDAKDEVELAKLRADQRMTQAQSGVQATKAAFTQEKTRLEAIARDVANCLISAATDGIVVYFVPERIRFGGAAPVVAQGEPVTAGQKLLRISDLRRMNLETKVHESQISQVRPGQAARVRVDALPNHPLDGRIGAVASVASAADWRNRDVKLYPVSVGLPEVNLPLKPGMTADVEIHIAAAKNVLRVPAAAVIRSRGKAACAVDTADGVREVHVETGISDGKFVEIKQGLKEGDKVLAPVK
jgi:RND family efflux transporter MFP subunit